MGVIALASSLFSSEGVPLLFLFSFESKEKEGAGQAEGMEVGSSDSRLEMLRLFLATSAPLDQDEGVEFESPGEGWVVRGLLSTVV
jgi:hypothetical protein